MSMLQEKRNDLAEKIRTKGKEFKSNGNEWASKSDKHDWDKLNADYDGVVDQMDQARTAPNVSDRLNQVNDLQNGPTDTRMFGRDDSGGTMQNRKASTAPIFRNLSNGCDVSALLPNEKFARSENHFGVAESAPSIGDVIHSLLTGEPRNMSAEKFNAQIGGSDSGGGFILAPSLTGHVVDLARSASVAMQAGAVTLPMDAREMHIARLAQDPVGHWRPEGVEVQASSLAFDRVTLRAKTLAAIVPISMELLDDAANIGTIINQALQAALGLALDSAVLFGTGAEETPRGIRNAEGVNTIAGVGTPADYTKVSAAVGSILDANYQGEVSGMSWITNPRDGLTFDGLTDTTGQPLNPTPWAGDLRRLSTTSLPADEGGGSNESVSIIGDFSQVLVGMRTTGVNIRILDSGQVSDANETHNATSQLKKIIVAHLRADVALLRPSWMTVLSGITAA